MSWDSAFWWPHEVLIAPMERGGGRGPRLGAELASRAEVEDSYRLVRTADGREVASSSRVTIPIGSPFHDVPLGSEVTLWPDQPGRRVAQVLAVSREENGPGLGSQLVLSLE